MSSEEGGSSLVPRPTEKFHDAKKRFDTEIKQLSKTAKGKDGKEKVAAKEKEVETILAKLKQHWDLYNRAENGEDVAEEYAAFTGETTAPPKDTTQSLDDLLANPIQMREVTVSKKKQKLLARDQREEEQSRRAAEIAASLPDLCKEENKKIDARLAKHVFQGSLAGIKGATVVEVAGDGHCLFRAVIQQLNFHASLAGGMSLHECYYKKFSKEFTDKLFELYGVKLDKKLTTMTVPILRRMVATQMILSPDDFFPFLVGTEVFNNGGGVEEYAAAVANDKVVLWGGELELNVLAQIFDVQLTVIQATGENPQYNPSAKGSVGPFVITFHAFWTSAGAHYNGVVPSK